VGEKASASRRESEREREREIERERDSYHIDKRSPRTATAQMSTDLYCILESCHA